MAAELYTPLEALSPEHTDTVSEGDQQRSQEQLRESLDDLGNLQCIRTSEFKDGRGFSRVRHTAAMEINGIRYALRITDPALEYTNTTDGVAAMLPGFTEDPSWGTAKQYHNDIATEYPERQIVSISSDGYNKDGSPFTIKDIGRGFNEMGEGRARLIGEVAGDKPTTVMGLSMGTVLARIAIKQNIENAFFNHDVTVYHSPAIVPPERILQDMALRFPIHIYRDVIKEALHHPVAALKAIHIPNPEIVPAYICDVYNLLHGTPECDIDQIASQTKLGAIVGDQDPLGQLGMWERLVQRYPENVHLLVKKGHGHGVSLNSREAARDTRQVASILLAKKALAAA